MITCKSISVFSMMLSQWCYFDSISVWIFRAIAWEICNIKLIKSRWTVSGEARQSRAILIANLAIVSHRCIGGTAKPTCWALILKLCIPALDARLYFDTSNIVLEYLQWHNMRIWYLPSWLFQQIWRNCCERHDLKIFFYAFYIQKYVFRISPMLSWISICVKSNLLNGKAIIVQCTIIRLYIL